MQHDLFGNVGNGQGVIVAPMFESGIVRNPIAIKLNRYLEKGDLHNAVSLIVDQNKQALEMIFLNAGFSVGSAKSKKELLSQIQIDLINASRLNMDGYTFEKIGRQIIKEKSNGNTISTKTIPTSNLADASGEWSAGNSIGESLGLGLAGNGEEPDQVGGVRTGFQNAVGAGTGSIDGAEQQIFTSDSHRNISIDESAIESADAKRENHVIEADHEIGSGSIQQKYAQNITAIKLIKLLESKKRDATLDERIALSKYSGFGSLKSVFDSENKNWNKQYLELKNLLTPEEYKSARASVLNAHYTSSKIVNPMYEMATMLGFQHGTIIEPSIGSGNFFGMMPQEMQSMSNLYGVELDLLTSKLAKHLYPTANIAVATGFENFNVPESTFDLAIGNPPYGSEKIVDPFRSDYSGFSIHNYFLCKMVDKVRDGGLVIAVVSNAFMDSKNSIAREWISNRANLITSVRLPNTAFLQNAGTEVVTDIVVFQKTKTPEISPKWLETTTIEIVNSKTEEIAEHSLNSFYLGNPDNVLGKHSTAGSMYRANSYTVDEVGDFEPALSEIINRLPDNLYQHVERVFEERKDIFEDIPEDVKVGCYFLNKEKVFQRGIDFADKATAVEWAPKNATAIERMKYMIRMKEILHDQMRLELNTDDERSIEKNRIFLNQFYEEFTQKFGYLNNRMNKSIFIDDTESPLLMSLEVDYDPGISKLIAEAQDIEAKEPAAKKSDIFNKRVLFQQIQTTRVENAKDSLIVSLNDKAELDLVYMSQIYGKSNEEIITELGDLVYFDLDKENWVTADEYLSGDVKSKLEITSKAVRKNRALERNVHALESVIPKDKLPSEIYASLGASWIPPQYFEEYAKKITGGDNINFFYVMAIAKWHNEMRGSGDDDLMKNQYGLPYADSFHLMSLAMAMQAPVIYENVIINGEEKRIVNADRTEAAIQKQNLLKEDWEGWIWSNPERSIHLSQIYNERFNRIVPRKYDGSHLVLPGSNPDIKLEPSQKDAIWQGIIERNILLDNVVGAGKTYVIVATAMELKRLGKLTKNMIAVPNHLTLQWRGEFTKLYPGANVLAATPDDFEAAKRQKFFSKIALNKYDSVIVGHSSLKKIALNPEFEAKIFGQNIDDISNAIEDMKRNRGDGKIVRDMERIKANLVGKQKTLLAKAGKKDNVLTFDQLGLDGLMVDEFHEFKNLAFYTQMHRVSGMGNPAGSGRATDLFNKFAWMRENYGNNFTQLTATGTVISNSMVEMFTVMRFHKYDQLKNDGLHLFDAWAQMWGKVENVYEISTSGIGFRRSERFTKFANMPSMMAMYHSFANVVTREDLIKNAERQGRRFPIPNIAGGKPQNIVAKRSPEQAEYFGIPYLQKDDQGNFNFAINPSTCEITMTKNNKWSITKITNGEETSTSFGTSESEESARKMFVKLSLAPMITIDDDTLLGKFANLPKLFKDSEGKINALSLTSLANKAGLDLRIINPYAEDFEGSKINLAIENMTRLYKKWNHVRGTQLVFCDMSVPNSARKSMAETPRRVYLRKDGELTHAYGTLHAIENYEIYKVCIVAKMAQGKKKYAVIEPTSGTSIEENFHTRAAALKWFEDYLLSADNLEQLQRVIETSTPITLDEIEEYRTEHDLEVLEDNSNEFTPGELFAVSVKQQFSVYEDIKTKLINSGVPEHEIAFIHDFDTPTKKAALFHNVNIGSVRFLLGSSPKMGAGTNVQKLLVGLHHIDAPWTPKDLEQREGRIIRQGNLLFLADPDNFEVFIARYATEQTYDARRWQLIEHKAIGIESIKRYNGENEIDGDINEASNASEMKAITSGNPLILLETKLREDVKRLEGLRKAHIDSQMMFSQQVRMLRNNLKESLPRQLSHLTKVVTNLADFPEHKGLDLFKSFEIDNFNPKDNDALQTSISKSIAFNSGRTPVAFKYRGLDVQIDVDHLDNAIHIFYTGDGVGSIGLESVTVQGLISRLRNKANRYSEDLEECKAEIRRQNKSLQDLLPKTGIAFPHQPQLQETTRLHDDIKISLMHQSTLEAVQPQARELFRKAVSAREQELIQLGYGAELAEYSKTKNINLDEVNIRIGEIRILTSENLIKNSVEVER